MAAAAALLLCLLSLLGPPGRLRASRAPGLGRRFSESKLCADAECSMLMYRGEALEDFTGPDCRFVNFKKGDPIYVYHKLAGRSPEVWAGSVGRSFGYFPRSLIHVASQYTTEELKVPADETDFVCFDGGRDDFDSYDLEELLGYLNLEKTLGDGQHETEEPEASEEGDPETELLESTNSEESEFSEDTQEPKDRQEAQKNRPLENGQADPAQGERPPFESFKDMLQEKLRVPESENKTGSVSQASDEQKMDAYTRLKKDMTLDLKTKFGSTADVLVSDDETTSLVTSLEDDLDEESEAEYHVMAQEEEDDGQDSSEEPPLLTFTDGEDGKTPAGSGVEKFLAEQERTLKEELLVQVAPPLGIQKAEKDTLTAWEDPLDPTGVEWESSDSGGAKEGGDALAPGSKLSKPQPAPYDVLDSDKVSAAPEGAQVPERNEGKDPKVDTQSPPREGKTAEPPKKDLVQNGAGLEDTELESTLTPGSAQSTKLRSSPTSAREQPALQSGPGNTEDDPDGTVVHVSKETLDKEKPAMQPPEEDAGTGSAGRGEGSPAKEGKPAREPAGPADNQRNASRDILEGKEAAESGAEPHRPSEEQPSEDSEEEWLYRAQNQPRFSSPDGLHWQRESEEDSPGVGRNVSRHQERGEATGVNKQVEGKRLLGEEDSSEEELDSGRPVSDTHEVGATGQAEDTEVPDLQSEEEEYVPEELLEDENAVSAQQAQANSPEAQGSPLGAILQTPERAALGASHPASGIEASVPSGTERKGETGAGEADPQGKQVGHRVLTDEDGPLAAKEAPRPPEVSSSPDKKTSQVPEEGEASPSKDREPPQGLGPQEPLKAPGLTQKPGLRELLKESQQKLTDTESQGSTSEEQEDEQRHRTPPLASPKDSPIISSFFQNLQSRQRFQKYFDVPRLEALLQEMSSKLQATQRDSLPSNVEKALDKVFRASESHILIEAEKMLDARVTQKRDLGAKDSDIFEEAAVLEDIQDLIYFVRYQHSLAEGSAAPAVVQLPEEGWDQTLEETSPPLKENLPHVHIETVTTQTPEEEPRHLDQPVTWDTGLSEVPPQPSADPGLITTQSPPVNAVDGQKQTEIRAEELSAPLESTVLSMTSFLSYIRSCFPLMATLSDDDQLGPDIYGLPWKPVFITAFLGIASFVIFFWKTILAVKSKIYQVTEQQISEKVKNIMKENAELQKKLLNYEQKMKESKKHIQEAKKQNLILSDSAVHSKDKMKKLEECNEALGDTTKKLRDMLASEREQNAKNQELILENKKSIEKLKDVILMNASELSEVQIALNEAKLSEEKVKSECQRVQEENAKLKKKKEQLQQEIKDWSKSHSKLSEQIKLFEKSQKDLETTLTHKDDNIDALNNCITQLNRLDCESDPGTENTGGKESDELANGQVGGNQSEKMKNKIKQMMDISRTQTAMSVVEEDLKLLQAKLRATMSTKCSLEDQIKKLEDDRNSLQSAKAGLEDECNTLRQKVEILNELYQQKEMVLQKKLSQEEYERQEREQRLTAADEKAVLAAEEVRTYKRRIEEMEEELLKTERSFKNQIATHEKKAHENWLKARAAERAMAEEKREAANLRHKLLELTQKMAMLQEEPVIVKPMPGRPSSQNLPRRGPLSQNGSFGPSPVSGECSPPLGADPPPARPLSATLGRRETPRSEFDPGSGAAPMNNSGSASPSKGLDEAKQTVPQESEDPSVASIPALAEPPAAVPLAVKGPPPFPGAPLMSSHMGGPLPPPIRYGPPPQLCRPFGPPLPPPIPPPFGPALRPPLGMREYAPRMPPGKRDVPIDPREFIPGHAPFRPLGPLGPREYYFPGPRLPPPPHSPQDFLLPPHGPQDHPPLPAARDLPPPGSRPEPPAAAQSGNQDSPPTFKQSP